MTITFKNVNHLIVYALEKVISYTRRTQQIFVAQCVWWLASIIGLEQGLIAHIDNIQKRESLTTPRNNLGNIHPDRTQQIEKAISPVPRDLTEDQRLDRVLDSAERCLAESDRIRITAQRNRVNPLPQTKTQLTKARKIKRLQEEKKKEEIERGLRLREIRTEVVQYLSKE
jgi:hypothetical protein